MSRLLACVALVLCAGCYDVAGLTSLYEGDGGMDLSASPDGGVTTFSPQALTLWAGQLGGGGSVDGTGSAARFDYPAGIGILDEDNVYVVDRDASTISHVTLSTGVVSRVAGSPGRVDLVDGPGPAARFNAPTSAVILGGQLYIADTDNNVIRKLDPATNVVTTLAGGRYGTADGTGTGARFGFPTGIVTDGFYLYVCDQTTNRIRRVDQTGVVVTIAGSGASSGYMDGDGLGAAFSSPTGAAVSGTTLFVLDQNNRLVRTVDLSDPLHTVSTLAGDKGIIASANDGPFTGTALARFGTLQAAVFVGTDLYVTDHYTQTIRALSTIMDVVTTTVGVPLMRGPADGTLTGAHLSSPTGIGATPSGRLVVADSGNHAVRLVDLVNDQVSTVAGVAEHLGGADGVGSQARFHGPTGLAAATDAVYVADRLGHLLRRVNLSGAVTTVAGTGVAGSLDGDMGTGLLDEPTGVAIGDDGTVYVSDSAQHTIRTWRQGVLGTLAGTAAMPGAADGKGTAAQLNDPNGLAVDATTLYVADTGNNLLRRITLADGTVTKLSLAVSGGVLGCAQATGIFAPMGLALDRARSILYVTARDNCAVLAVDLATDKTTVVAGGPAGSDDGVGVLALLDHPTALALDDAGILYVSDAGNATLRRLDPATAAMSTIAGHVDFAKVVLGTLPMEARLNRAGGLAYVPGLGLVASIPTEDALLLLK